MSERSEREKSFEGNNWGVSIPERAIGEQGIGEQGIGYQTNLGAGDQGVVKINNTVRNECKLFCFDTPLVCHETL